MAGPELETRVCPPGLEPRQLRAIELLIMGNDMATVARKCGVTVPVMFEWRYSLPFAEEMAKRLSDIRAMVHAEILGRSREMLKVILEIARDPDHRDRFKAAQYLIDKGFEQQSPYTTQAEWNAAREHARKSAYAELWPLTDAAILDTVRKLKSLPSGDK